MDAQGPIATKEPQDSLEGKRILKEVVNHPHLLGARIMMIIY
jgi:hypothetical protein